MSSSSFPEADAMLDGAEQALTELDVRKAARLCARASRVLQRNLGDSGTSSGSTVQARLLDLERRISILRVPTRSADQNHAQPREAPTATQPAAEGIPHRQIPRPGPDRGPVAQLHLNDTISMAQRWLEAGYGRVRDCQSFLGRQVASATGLPVDACEAGVALLAMIALAAAIRYMLCGGNAVFTFGRMPGDIFHSDGTDTADGAGSSGLGPSRGATGRQNGHQDSGTHFVVSAPFASMAVLYWCGSFLAWVWNWRGAG